MPSVWEHRWSEVLRRLAGLRESTSLDLLPDLMPTLDLLSADPFVALWRRERLWSVALRRTAAAGNLPTISVCNTTPGLLSVIETVIVNSSESARVVAELTTYVTGAGSPPDAGTAAREFTDRRIKAGASGSEEPNTFIAQADQVGVIPGIEVFDVQMAAAAVHVIPTRIVLTENTVLRVQGQLPAGTITISAFGREWSPDEPSGR